MTQRPRWSLAEGVTVASGKPSQLEESVRHGDVRHRRCARLGGAQRGAGGTEALPEHVLLRTDADDVVERSAQRALTDPGDAAQFGDSYRLSEVVAKELVDAGDDLMTRDVVDN